MTPAAIIDALIAAGTPAKLVVEVARIFQRFETEAESLAKAREQNRIRQRKHRERNVMSRDVTLRDPAYVREESKKEGKKVSTKTLLPEDFTFNETDRAAIRQAGWSAEKTETELMRFKDHALMHGRRCVDWHAAWRSWVRSPYQTKPANGAMNGYHRETTAEKGRRLAADLGAKMRGETRPIGSHDGRDANVVSLPGQQRRLL